MEKTTKRALLLMAGLLTAGWLFYAQQQTPVPGLDQASEMAVKDPLLKDPQQLKIKLLLMGFEVVIDRNWTK